MKNINKKRKNSKRGVKGFIKLNNDWGDPRFRQIFSSINHRCYSKKYIQHHLYSGKGIICEWKAFSDFKNDMYKSYCSHIKKFGKNNTSIDRIDNSGNYCKENCRWATRIEQARNKTNNIRYFFNGLNLTRREWAEKTGINKETIRWRISNGWTIEKSLQLRNEFATM